MINSTFNKTPDTNKIFAQFKKDTQTSKNNVEVQQNSNMLQQDTFEKKDKKKIARNVAIGLGVMAFAYSVFALVKYGSGNRSIKEALVEPVKILLARINPNGFKPSVAIEEDYDGFLGEVSTHLNRLKIVSKKEKYIQHLFETINFTEEGKDELIRIYGKYLN